MAYPGYKKTQNCDKTVPLAHCKEEPPPKPPALPKTGTQIYLSMTCTCRCEKKVDIRIDFRSEKNLYENLAVIEEKRNKLYLEETTILGLFALHKD